MSDSVRPHRQQPTRLPHPWDSPGKNTGVSCHFLLQCMKVKSESEVTQSCPTLSDPMDCSPPGSSVHGIFQARVLEWGAIAFSTAQHTACKIDNALVSYLEYCNLQNFHGKQMDLDGNGKCPEMQPRTFALNKKLREKSRLYKKKSRISKLFYLI